MEDEDEDATALVGVAGISSCGTILSDMLTRLSTKLSKTSFSLGLSWFVLSWPATVFLSSNEVRMLHTFLNCWLRSTDGASGLALFLAALVLKVVNTVFRSLSSLAAARYFGRCLASCGIWS